MRNDATSSKYALQVTQQAKTLAGQYDCQRFPAFEGNCALAHLSALPGAMPCVQERSRVVFEAAADDQFYGRHGCTFNLFDGVDGRDKSGQSRR
jgi:hypothetical protein